MILVSSYLHLFWENFDIFLFCAAVGYFSGCIIAEWGKK